MTEDEFWQLIQEGVNRQDLNELDISGLEAALEASSPERILAYATHFERFNESFNDEVLWGAAYLMNGGCSDDGFDYFRGWLIGMGRAAFTKAMKHPDSLAELDAEDVECEDLISLHYSIYEEKTGSELEVPDEVGEKTSTIEYEKGTWDFNAGQGWDFEDDAEMSKRYPKLFAKFC